ncbi:MAG: hypothetical protein SGCHY_001930 [Lobulomycetales sp.]
MKEVGCRELRVVSLNFSNQNVARDIPSSIVKLTMLEEIDLSGSMISGSIPAEIGSLSNLKTLKLNDNSLGGVIPASLSNIPNLEILNLANNDLRGDFPLSLLELTLEELNISGNPGLSYDLVDGANIDPANILRGSTEAVESPNTEAVVIIACSVSAVLLLAILGGLVFWLRRRRRIQRMKEMDSSFYRTPSEINGLEMYSLVSEVIDDSSKKRSNAPPVNQPSNVRKTKKLAEGGFGEVWKGTFKGRVVAIKILKGSITPNNQKNFLRECETMLRMRHERIVEFIDIGEI